MRSRRLMMDITFLVSLVAFTTLTIVPNAPAQERRPQQTVGRGNRSPRETSAGGSQTKMAEQIRKELVTLPYYDVFDYLEGNVTADGVVTLRGQVVRPTTKSDAEARARDVDGVTRVNNEIEVLPLSPNDDRIRLAIYRELFNFNSPLFRYATRAVPPIHIIVKSGRATLKGIVATEQDSQVAYIRARTVPGVFEVTNELRVENQRAR